MNKIYGIDVSSYNGAIDWAKVQKAGCGHAVLKIVRKELAVDRQFTANLQGCKAQSIPYGVYRYVYESSVAAAQKAAQAVVALLDQYGAAPGVIVWWDVEDGTLQSTAKTTLTPSILAARNVIEDAGYGFGVYTGLYWYNSVLDTDGLDCPFWIARYPSTAAVAFGTAPKDQYQPSIKHTLWGWQYSSAGVVSGIRHLTDLNVVYGLDGHSANATGTSKDAILLHQAYVNSVTDAGIAVDGIFGPKTLKASIMALQTLLNRLNNAGLAADGIFGPKTRAAVETLKRGSSGVLVHLLQGMLYCRGYDPKGLDYSFGAGTEAAVRAFQTDAGIAVDGIAGPVTWETLMAR